MSQRGTESAVFRLLADWLEQQGYQFYVHIPDTHHRKGHYSKLLNEYPTHSISIGPYKPDVVGFTPANRVFAIEVKGRDGLRKGIGQAISYQRGVDHVYLATEAIALSRVRDLALSKGIGVLSVSTEDGTVSPTHPYSTEMKDLLYNTRHQLENRQIMINQDSQRLPNFADPLNELMPVLAIAAHDRKTEQEIGRLCEMVEYPYRRAYKRMIRLADFLGMIHFDGEIYRLTTQGDLGKIVLQGYGISTVEGLMELKAHDSLWKEHPPIATYLRNRFASIPDFRTLFDVLVRHRPERISIQELCEVLITNYPSTFLNLVYTDNTDSRGAPELIEQGRGREVYSDPDYLVEIIHSQFISNMVSHFRNLGILTDASSVIEPKTDLQPENHYWYPRQFDLQ